MGDTPVPESLQKQVAMHEGFLKRKQEAEALAKERARVEKEFIEDINAVVETPAGSRLFVNMCRISGMYRVSKSVVDADQRVDVNAMLVNTGWEGFYKHLRSFIKPALRHTIEERAETQEVNINA